MSQHMGILTIAGVCVHLVPFYNAVRAVTNMFIRAPQNILRCLCEIGPSWDADCQRWTMSFHRLTSFPFTLCQPNRTINLNFRGALLGPKKNELISTPDLQRINVMFAAPIVGQMSSSANGDEDH